MSPLLLRRCQNLPPDGGIQLFLAEFLLHSCENRWDGLLTRALPHFEALASCGGLLPVAVDSRQRVPDSPFLLAARQSAIAAISNSGLNLRKLILRLLCANQLSALPPNTCSSRTAISGEMPRFPFTSSESVERVTCNAAASVIVKPRGLIQSCSTTLPGCEGFFIRRVNSPPSGSPGNPRHAPHHRRSEK